MMGLFEQFPYQNFHELNLDWLINEIKTLETSGLVLSVNGMTGDVTLYEENIVRLPDVANSSWNIFRKNDGQDNGIEFTKNMPMTRIQGSSRFAVYDAGNPPPYPVTSVNGATGDVTLYPNNVTQLPSVANSTWNIYRITDGQENGIEWTKNQPMTRIQGTSRFTVYDTGNPPPNFADTSAPDLQLPVDTTGTSWSINRNIGSGNLGLLLGVTGGQEEAYIQYDDGVTPSLVKLLTPADIPSSSGVVSFNGQTGVVTADASTLEMSSSDSTSIDDTITNIENDIAILINVSTAAVNVSAGQYVLVQNSGMTGVQDGLYISNTAVPAGTPFTSAYLDAVSNGGLNSLNDHIANITESITWTPTINGITYTDLTDNYAVRTGNLVIARCYFKVSTATTSNAYIDQSSIPSFNKTKKFGHGTWLDNSSDNAGIIAAPANNNAWFWGSNGQHMNLSGYTNRYIYISYAYVLE